MTIFKFIMLSDEQEDFERVYEVEYDMNLRDFHDFICEELEYDPGSFSSIFLSDDSWGKLQEYTLVDMQDEGSGVVALPMQETLIGQIIKSKRDRMLFMFDIFAGRSFFLELQEIYEAEEDVRYPRVASGQGDPPPQFDAESLISEESPFNDIMSEFADFEGDDDYQDDM